MAHTETPIATTTSRRNDPRHTARSRGARRDTMVVSSEVKLVSAAAGLYGSFLYWGYLQEKITGADYVSPLDASVTGRWHFSFVLNGEPERREARKTEEGGRPTPRQTALHSAHPDKPDGRESGPRKHKPTPLSLSDFTSFRQGSKQQWRLNVFGLGEEGGGGARAVVSDFLVLSSGRELASAFSSSVRTDHVSSP